jgi:transposase
LQADAANVFDQLYSSGQIVEVGCWAHARRYFHDSMNSDPLRAAQAIVRIQDFYEIERRAKEAIERDQLTGEAADALRLQMRRERTLPLLEKFAEWIELERPRVLPKSAFGQAISYAQNQWQALLRFTERGFLSIDNNAAERAHRPVAIGRKNWLFAGSDKGGQTAAILFTLTQTCRALKADPWEYLRDTLTQYPIWQAASHPPETIDQFAPHRWHQTQSAKPE